MLTGGYLLTEWRPDLISSVLDHLSPDTVRVAVIAQQFSEQCEDTERWYGARYNFPIIINTCSPVHLQVHLQQDPYREDRGVEDAGAE